MNTMVRLGATVLGVILKIASKGEFVGHVVDGALQVVDLAGDDIFSKRNIERTSQAISDDISKSCNEILDHHHIAEDRKTIFYGHLIDVVDAADLTYDLIVSKKASVDEVNRLFSTLAGRYEKEFDPSEFELFNGLLRHVSQIIVNAALESRRFTNHGIKYIVAMVSDLYQKMEKILEAVEKIDQAVSKKSEDFKKFEKIYRSNVAEKYGWIQLLGAKTLSRDERRYKLSIAYVALEMKKGNNTNNTLEIGDIFSKSKRLWIDGDAGSGKSTLLQWIAVNSALNDGEILSQINDSIPFLIELRKQNARQISIKKAVDSIMVDSDCSIPENWLSYNLESGNAIVLVDGFDEVKCEDRDYVLTWIEDFVCKYPKTKIVVTSRPQIGDKAIKGFAKYRLLPMTREKIDLFLKYWHEAVLIDKLEIPKIEAYQYMRKLSAQIDNSESIRKMVTNPLLCAMLCALHYKNGSIISNERNELYDDCCKMLFGNRDSEKDVQAFSHIELSYDEKKTILAQLAYWMMKNNLIVAEEEEVISRIRYSIRGLRQASQKNNPEELFQYFLERSGILRSPEVGRVDFIHKSFQEYLAAFEIHNQDDWGFIADKAGDINWHETLVLSMGFASVHNSKLVIERILGDGNQEKNIVIAAACVSNSSRLDPALRENVNKKIAKILPPQGIEESERLVGAGEFVVPRLTNKAGLTKEERYYCLNTLRMISSKQGLLVAGTYLDNSVSQEELILIGNMLKGYTNQEILACNFKKSILEYLEETAINGTLYIPESFLCCLSISDLSNISGMISHFTKMIILDFCNKVTPQALSLFKSVTEIELIGFFDNISSIAMVSDQLQSLLLCDYSKHFDFYELNQYSFKVLKCLQFHSSKVVYINGADCNSIANIRELGLHLYNMSSELFFDNFKKFSNLTSLTIFHGDIFDLPLIDLVYYSNVKELTLKFSKDVHKRYFHEVQQQLYKIPRIVTEHFDNPYNFNEALLEI